MGSYEHFVIHLSGIPSRGGLEVERPLRIQLKAGLSYLVGFESCLGHGYIDIICNIITHCNNPLPTVILSDMS